MKDRNPVSELSAAQTRTPEAENVGMPSELSGDWSSADLEEQIEWFRAYYGDHPTFNLSNGQKIMTKSISACLQLAGGLGRWSDVVTWALLSSKDESARARRCSSVRNSRYLGGFLQTVFPSWMEEYDRAVADGSQDPDDHLEECVGVGENEDSKGYVEAGDEPGEEDYNDVVPRDPDLEDLL